MPFTGSLSRILLLLVIYCFTTSHADCQSVSVADFGIKPDSYENVTPRVQKIIEHIGKNNISKLVFPKGRYDFWPDGAIRAKYFVSNTSTEQGG